MWTINHIQYKSNYILFWLLAGAIILFGCNTTSPPEPTLTSQTNIPSQPTQAATVPAIATSTHAPEPTSDAIPTTDITLSPTPNPDNELYLDDRSDPITVLNSLVNAINRHEYLRAYSYWKENTPDLPPYEQFAEGYAETAFVQLQTGTIYAGVAAGNTYYDVPVILTAQTSQGDSQHFVGCYRLHLASPGVQGAPPFRPLAIESAQINQVATPEEAQTSLEQQCFDENDQIGGQPWPAPPVTTEDDISADLYLDDRSSSLQIIRSYFNALNRHEYVRAYDYWENQAVLGPLEDFIAGYENTSSIDLLTGSATLDAGAGQLYSQVPVILISQITTGETETFAGCYTLHLSNPAIQATLPFQPWGIQSAEIHQIDNNADLNQSLAAGCP